MLANTTTKEMNSKQKDDTIPTPTLSGEATSGTALLFGRPGGGGAGPRMCRTPPALLGVVIVAVLPTGEVVVVAVGDVTLEADEGTVAAETAAAAAAAAAADRAAGVGGGTEGAAGTAAAADDVSEVGRVRPRLLAAAAPGGSMEEVGMRSEDCRSYWAARWASSCSLRRCRSSSRRRCVSWSIRTRASFI
jgi:hypothetical protein